MRIGIDLDNTIIDYTEAFLYGAHQHELISENWRGSKKELKGLISSHYKGEQEWQRLQGKVYGEWIHHAKLYSGVFRFLWRCRLRGWTTIVVSHKTKYGHFDPDKISLRKAAIDFLKYYQVWESDGSGLLEVLRFETTREEKIQTITELQCDVFIDDLPEVLVNTNFPSQPQPILFDPEDQYSKSSLQRAQSWDDLAKTLLGVWSDWELKTLARLCGISSVEDVRTVSGGGNSQVYHVTSETGNKYALKIYPPDSAHDRLRSEFDGMQIIHLNFTAPIPKPVGINRELAVASFEWVDGKPIKNPTQYDIIQAVNFLSSLHKFCHHTKFLNFPRASAACLSGKEIEQQLKVRFELLLNEKNEALNLFLNSDFISLFQKMLDRSKSLWPNQDFGLILKPEQQILSPSDFGFHNALRSKKKSLVFLDFEYFGWDDPIKLMCDFAFHPGMDLNQEMRKYWFQSTLKIYGDELLHRLNASWPLYGLCWALILLNEFRRDIWKRRHAANPSLTDSRVALQQFQLKRSRELLQFIDNSVKTQTFDFN